jgi:putative tryptophan/tyrosine transport system substrate-binding protein
VQLLVEEITRVLDEPWLPCGHTGALEQVWEKVEAQAALDKLRRDLPGLSRNPAVAALLHETRSIPIVFALVSDSVGSGFVASMAHPGGNITGFQNFEPALAGKWLEVLKEIAPSVRQVAFLHVPQVAVHMAFLHVVESASTSLGVKVIAAGIHDAGDIRATITAFAQEPNGGLIVVPSPLTTIERELIITLVDRL